MQFRADFVTYFKNGYREYRTADGANGWSAQTAGYGSYADNGGSNTRELAIPWTAINAGGRPASFAWHGYITSAGGFVYGQVPTANAGGTIGASARYERYYIVNDTTNTAQATYPFAHDSFVFNSATNEINFGAISVWDFTLNSAGLSLTAASGAVWNIGHDLRVDAGNLHLEGIGATTTTVSNDVYVANTGSVNLSTNAGANLNIGGNLTAPGGPWQPQGSAVTFNGSGTQVITANNAGGGGLIISFNLIIAGPNVITAGSVPVETGDGSTSGPTSLTINAGASFKPATQVIVFGSLLNNGTLSPTAGTFQIANFGSGLDTFTNNGTFAPTIILFDLQAFNDNAFLVVNSAGASFNAAAGSTQFRIDGNTTFSGTNLSFATLYINNSPANNVLTGTNGTTNVRDFFTGLGTYRGQNGTVAFNGATTLLGSASADLQFHNISVPTGNSLNINTAPGLLKVNGNISNIGSISAVYNSIINFNGATRSAALAHSSSPR